MEGALLLSDFSAGGIEDPVEDRWILDIIFHKLYQARVPLHVHRVLLVMLDLYFRTYLGFVGARIVVAGG